MAAREVDIANAIVGELNDPARAWSGQFTASRLWLPVFEPPELATLKVSVVPMTLDQEEYGREIDRYLYTTAIDFQQRVNPTDTAAMDALTALVESVHDFYSDSHFLGGLPGWQVARALRESVYALETLYAEHTWESLLLVTVGGLR